MQMAVAVKPEGNGIVTVPTKPTVKLEICPVICTARSFSNRQLTIGVVVTDVNMILTDKEREIDSMARPNSIDRTHGEL